MARPKSMTVGQLVALLLTKDQSLPVVIYRDGNGHYNIVEPDDVEEVDNVYFANVDAKKVKKALKIGWI